MVKAAIIVNVLLSALLVHILNAADTTHVHGIFSSTLGFLFFGFLGCGFLVIPAGLASSSN
jgi:hypothetical protein